MGYKKFEDDVHLKTGFMPGKESLKVGANYYTGGGIEPHVVDLEPGLGVIIRGRTGSFGRRVLRGLSNPGYGYRHGYQYKVRYGIWPQPDIKGLDQGIPKEQFPKLELLMKKNDLLLNDYRADLKKMKDLSSALQKERDRYHKEVYYNQFKIRKEIIKFYKDAKKTLEEAQSNYPEVWEAVENSQKSLMSLNDIIGTLNKFIADSEEYESWIPYYSKWTSGQRDKVIELRTEQIKFLKLEDTDISFLGGVFAFGTKSVVKMPSILAKAMTYVKAVPQIVLAALSLFALYKVGGWFGFWSKKDTDAAYIDAATKFEKAKEEKREKIINDTVTLLRSLTPDAVKEAFMSLSSDPNFSTEVQRRLGLLPPEGMKGLYQSMENEVERAKRIIAGGNRSYEANERQKPPSPLKPPGPTLWQSMLIGVGLYFVVIETGILRGLIERVRIPTIPKKEPVESKPRRLPPVYRRVAERIYEPE